MYNEDIEKNGFNINNGFQIADELISDYANNPEPYLNLSSTEDLLLYKRLEKIYS